MSGIKDREEEPKRKDRRYGSREGTHCARKATFAWLNFASSLASASIYLAKLANPHCPRVRQVRPGALDTSARRVETPLTSREKRASIAGELRPSADMACDACTVASCMSATSNTSTFPQVRVSPRLPRGMLASQPQSSTRGCALACLIRLRGHHTTCQSVTPGLHQWLSLPVYETKRGQRDLDRDGRIEYKRCTVPGEAGAVR